MIAQIQPMEKVSGILKVCVSFISFDEFLAFYAIHSNGNGIISFYLENHVDEKAEVEISLSLLNQPLFLNTHGRILKIIKETLDQKQMIQVELNHFNKKGEELLARLIELQSQRKSEYVRF